MKVTVTQENLSKALNIVSRVASSHTSLPILNNILIKTENNQLILSATNLEIAITESINAKVDKDGILTIPAKLMTDFISQLPKNSISMTLSDNKLKITSGNYKSVINTTIADEFPVIPTVRGKTKFKISSELFKTAAQQTTLVASNDTSRPILTGAYLHTHNGNLFITTTDGYRLAEKKIMKQEDEISVIIPVSTINDVLRVLTDEVTEIDIKINNEQIEFKIDSVVINSRLIDGNFINYRSLIPSKTENSAILDKTEFLRIIKISELFARESAGSIVIKADEKSQVLKINSITNEFGENTAEIEGEISGDGQITLNSRYLIDAINCITEERVKFNFSGKLAPSLLTAEKDIDYKHIIMPVKS